MSNKYGPLAGKKVKKSVREMKKENLKLVEVVSV